MEVDLYNTLVEMRNQILLNREYLIEITKTLLDEEYESPLIKETLKELEEQPEKENETKTKLRDWTRTKNRNRRKRQQTKRNNLHRQTTMDNNDNTNNLPNIFSHKMQNNNEPTRRTSMYDKKPNMPTRTNTNTKRLHNNRQHIQKHNNKGENMTQLTKNLPLKTLNEEELDKKDRKKLEKFKNNLLEAIPKLEKAYEIVIQGLKDLETLQDKTIKEKQELEEKIRKDIIRTLIKSMDVIVIYQDEKEEKEHTNQSLNELPTTELVKLLKENIETLKKYLGIRGEEEWHTTNKKKTHY